MSDLNQSFDEWMNNAKSEGLVDMKFAISNLSTSRREVLEGFMDAKNAIANGLVHDSLPSAVGEASSQVTSLLENH